MQKWMTQFQLQIRLHRAGPEKAVKSTAVETFQFLRTLPATDRDGAKASTTVYCETHMGLCWLIGDSWTSSSLLITWALLGASRLSYWLPKVFPTSPFLIPLLACHLILVINKTNSCHKGLGSISWLAWGVREPRGYEALPSINSLLIWENKKVFQYKSSDLAGPAISLQFLNTDEKKKCISSANEKRQFPFSNINEEKKIKHFSDRRKCICFRPLVILWTLFFKPLW